MVNDLIWFAKEPDPSHSHRHSDHSGVTWRDFYLRNIVLLVECRRTEGVEIRPGAYSGGDGNGNGNFEDIKIDV